MFWCSHFDGDASKCGLVAILVAGIMIEFPGKNTVI
jgi:hypothetical protein